MSLHYSRQKYAFTNQKKCTATQNKHTKLKPGLIAFYDIRRGNGTGLFSKEKISKDGDTQGKVKRKRIGGEAYDIYK